MLSVLGEEVQAGDGALGRATKKVLRRPEETPNAADPVVDEQGIEVHSNATKSSRKDKLMGQIREDRIV